MSISRQATDKPQTVERLRTWAEYMDTVLRTVHFEANRPTGVRQSYSSERQTPQGPYSIKMPCSKSQHQVVLLVCPMALKRPRKIIRHNLKRKQNKT